MKIISAGFVLVLLIVCGRATAQSARYEPLTWDGWVDDQIFIYDQYGMADRQAYLDDLVHRFGGDRAWYEDELARPDMSPGQLFYSCALAREAKLHCATVLADRKHAQSQGEGWMALAQRYGINAGSAEFHRMRSFTRNDGAISNDALP